MSEYGKKEGKKHLYTTVKSGVASPTTPQPDPNQPQDQSLPRSKPPSIVPLPDTDQLKLSPHKPLTTAHEEVNVREDHALQTLNNERHRDNGDDVTQHRGDDITQHRGNDITQHHQMSLYGRDEVLEDKLNEKENNEEVAMPSEHGKKKTKKAGRIVPSRYKMAASNFKKPSQPVIAEDSRHHQSIVKSKKVTGNGRAKMNATSCKTKPVSLNKQFHLSTVATPFKPGVPGIVTSTPAVSTAKQPLPFDQSLPTTTTGSTIRNASNMPKHDKKMSKTRYLEHRLLQAAYLDVMSQKAFEEQDRTAQKQLYALWSTVEEVKREVAELERAIATEKAMITLDKSLDIQISGLEPLSKLISDVQDSHTKLATTLDTTRHDVALRNIDSLDEAELSTQLRETEDILADILPRIREDIPLVTSLSETHQDLLSTAETEFLEVERLWKKLSKVTKLQLQQTSLFLEGMQRRKDAN